jgi:ABC-2 type transport system ATP-binding protein
MYRAAAPQLVSKKETPGGARNNGSIIELKVRDAGDVFLSRLAQMNLTIQSIEPMNLEDIFVTSTRAGERA